ILYDIKQQKQTLEFKDGIFFNGIDNMSIRVGHQDPATGQLYDVLIYDTRDPGGNMTTTMAESGFIRISDDKQFLLVTLYNGETYETTRNYRWSEENALRHHIFTEQNGAIKMDGFAFERTDVSLFNSSQTKGVKELQMDIDSLSHLASINTRRSYQPLLETYLFTMDRGVMGLLDTVEVERLPMEQLALSDSLFSADYRRSFLIWDKAANQAEASRTILSFNETTAKDNLNQLYKAEVEWHRKIALPFSVVIFFLIGAPLGAIIRRGGLGMPTVVSVLFFVFYYIVSMMGEKMAKEGSMGAFEGMWISSFILFPIAIYLTYKATNDSNLLNVDWYYMKYVALRDWLRERFGKKKKLSAKKNG
ncbi:MAG: LptF/LptG family permease, partial [Tidjanibacter sp.]|nr:LptF/LptG family permease [Tidjanibacter sp.]